MANSATYNRTKIHFAEGAAAATPDAAEVVIYSKADGLMYSKDDAGTETLMSGGAGGGSVATDAIWDAAGDQVVGTGANTAARVAAGAAGRIWVAAGAAAPVWTPLAAGKVSLTSGDLTTTSGTFVDATGLTVTLTTGAHRCLVTATGTLTHSAASAGIALDIAVDGTRQGQTYGLQIISVATPNNFAFSLSYLTDVLTAASHTIKLQWLTTTATATLYASAGVTPAVFSVEETLLIA